MFAFTATEHLRDGGIVATLSAEWDTLRDACLAAKIHYGLNLQEFKKLKDGLTIVHRRIEIRVSEVRSANPKSD